MTRRPSRSILRRPAKSILPPDVVDGGPPDRPVLVRQAKLRYNRPNVTVQALRNYRKRFPDHQWRPVEITIPREIIETAGWEPDMTICMEAYVDGRVRMFPAGDRLSREEELL